MSIVLLNEHNESIYNVKKNLDTERVVREGIYKTAHSERLKQEKRDPRVYQAHGTMGKPISALPSASHFLKKNTGKPPMRPPEQIDPSYGHHECLKKEKTPPVPPRDEVMKEQDDKLKYKRKNMIRRNIERALAMKPKTPNRIVVVSRHGFKSHLRAGLEPKYIYSDLYGTLPKYVDNLIKQQEKSLLKSLEESAEKTQPLCTYITRSHRERLLAGLKANWAELQCQYQLLPILTDTMPKKNRKSKLEADLKQLEKDIVLIERHPYIYVYADSDMPNNEN